MNVNSARLERWLGKERVEDLSKNFHGWYGPPVPILDLPGGVKIHGDGDFSGPFERGYFCSALDALESRVRPLIKRFGSMRLDPATLQMAGFTSISNALNSISSGNGFVMSGGNVVKTGTAPGAVAACCDLFYAAGNPGAGSAPSGVPGGTATTNATTGAMTFPSPAPGGQYSMLVGADMMASVATMSILIYDRTFSVLATASSSSTQAVTGVPTRYQNTTSGTQDYCGHVFMFVSAQSTLGAVAHNWTVCKYTNQASSSANFPSITGINACAANRLDMPVGSWFAPLASGDVGILAITQLQASVATVTGSATFNLGANIGIMSFPLANYIYPFDWLTNRNLAPRIFDAACPALLQLPCSANSATTFTGNIYGGQA